MFFLIFFTSLVGHVLYTSATSNSFHLTLLQNHFLETTWTITPVICLVQIALPSLMLLYVTEEFIECDLTLKTVGHQWYWSYEYTDFFFKSHEGAVELDSFMIPGDTTSTDNFRLLDVDNRVVLPLMAHIRVLISRADVIHSWTVPVMGVKADASPGRVNQVSFVNYRPGVFYGQCSEICGANHRFIPIVIEISSTEDFINWLLRLWESNSS